MYMRGNNRGSLELFVELFLIVILLFAFLFATHARDQFRKDQEAARAVYPGAIKQLPPGTAQPNSGVILPQTDPKAPEIPAYRLPGGMTKGSYTEVVYTDKGFIPSIVKLDEDFRTVVFRNQSSKVMWIASDPYPINSDYPLLNEGSGVTKNGIYWFVFPAGAKTYGYHNDQFPGHKGTVIVK